LARVTLDACNDEATRPMADGIQALTEKEKQALRLLLGGHDAKSMATQLGLSVHTINERLREARRKLGVSSSKAAARVLREVEAPQLLGDKISGDAGAGLSVQTFDPGPAHSPRAAWTIGGFAMITLFVAALALSSTGPAAPPAQATATAPETAVAESEASRAARDWLALVDAQKWPDSWAATAGSFRKVNTVANWQAAAEGVHARLGPAQSRELLSDFDTPSAHDVRAVRFRTIFPGNQVKTETLSLTREGGQWRVAGIFLE
jgi:DNA-binding CsgD family transcriptional regulator